MKMKLKNGNPNLEPPPSPTAHLLCSSTCFSSFTRHHTIYILDQNSSSNLICKKEEPSCSSRHYAHITSRDPNQTRLFASTPVKPSPTRSLSSHCIGASLFFLLSGSLVLVSLFLCFLPPVTFLAWPSIPFLHLAQAPNPAQVQGYLQEYSKLCQGN